MPPVQEPRMGQLFPPCWLPWAVRPVAPLGRHWGSGGGDTSTAAQLVGGRALLVCSELAAQAVLQAPHFQTLCSGSRVACPKVIRRSLCWASREVLTEPSALGKTTHITLLEGQNAHAHTSPSHTHTPPPPGLESAQTAVLKASAPRAESSPCLRLLGSLHTLCFPSLSREVGWSLHLPCAEGERIL